jgi:hypothetical protein
MTQLAAELRADPEHLRLAFEHCERMGYLERVDGACDLSGCASCPLATGCQPTVPVPTRRELPAGPSWWRVTERGVHAIRRSAVRP